ncbi:polysaccharide pyruvyl transferase family protein [Thermococcus litoralis]|uniref:polysaccharide pyruvyl transferase family protein n=1 Tax=Thermococcus litoralis TaxID=2265 RepID=UPI0015C50E48|nr:polysaccharide pyruvyl transferase family protein [Thermococcus litoralis]
MKKPLTNYLTLNDLMIPQEFIRNKRVIIIGNYGDGNLGDEAMLLVLLRYLRKQEVSSVYIPTKNTKFILETYHYKFPFVFPIYFLDVVRVLLLFLYGDTIIIGGGSIYSQESGIGTMFSSILAFLVKVLFRKRLIFIGIGYSKHTKRLLKEISKLPLSVADIISVRDNQSLNNIISLGVKPDNVIVTKDLTLSSLLLPASSQYGKEILIREGVPTNDEVMLIGISVRYTDNKIANENIVEVLPKVIKWILDNATNAYIIFLPFGPAYVSKVSDSKFALQILSQLPERYKKRCKIISYHPPSIMLSIIKHLDVLIGMRYHALVFAYKVGVPYIGISYDEKCTNFLIDTNNRIIAAENLTVDDLINELKKYVGRENNEEIS